MRKFRNRIDTKSLGLDLGIEFVRFLTGKEHLHYGLWENDIDVCARNLLTAQEAYTEKLLSLLPPDGPLRILDIGGGAGETARKLLADGHVVDIVVPSPTLAERCRSIDSANLSVHQTTFEEFETNDVFEVCLFSESFQYVPLDQSLTKAKKLLAKDSRIIIADCFRSDAIFQTHLNFRPVGSGHYIGDFRAEVANSELEVVFEEDITLQVAPSVELEQEFYTFVGNSAHRINTDIRKSFPQVRAALSYIIRRFVNEHSREKMWNRLYKRDRNAQEFCKFNHYLMMILKVKPML